MSDTPPNGSGEHRTPGPLPIPIAEQISKHMSRLARNVEEARTALKIQELRLDGLAGVLMHGVLGLDGSRIPILFAQEHADSAAGIVKDTGDVLHTLGSEMYKSAEAIRGAAKKGG